MLCRDICIHSIKHSRSVATRAAAVDAQMDGADGKESSLPMIWPARSNGAGTVGGVEVGTEVTLCGWVDSYRNHGGVVFVDLRDHTGFCQVSTAV